MYDILKLAEEIVSRAEKITRIGLEEDHFSRYTVIIYGIGSNGLGFTSRYSMGKGDTIRLAKDLSGITGLPVELVGDWIVRSINFTCKED